MPGDASALRPSARICSWKSRMRFGIWAIGRTRSTRPVAIELRGMSPYFAVTGSCTTTRPPYSLMRFSPDDPFGPVPDRMTAAACEPRASASERKNMSTGARRSSFRVMSATSMASPSMRSILFGGTT